MGKNSILHQMIDEKIYPGRAGNAELLEPGSHYDVEKFLEEIDKIFGFNEIYGVEERFLDYMVMWGEIAVVRKLLEKGEKSNIQLEEIVQDDSAINAIELQMKYLGTMEMVNEYRLKVIELFLNYNAFWHENVFWREDGDGLVGQIIGLLKHSNRKYDLDYIRNLLELFLDKRGDKIYDLSEHILGYVSRCVEADSPEMIKILLNHGAALPDASALAKDNSPASVGMLYEMQFWLAEALRRKNNDMLALLLENCNYDKESLIKAASKVENENQLEQLVKAGTVIEPDAAESLFFNAESCLVVKYLIDKGVDPGIRDKNGHTKLLMNNSYDMLKLLLSYEKRDINDVFEEYLAFGRRELSVPVLKAFFESGLDIRDDNIDYAVIAQKLDGSIDAIKLLVENGVNIINAKGSDGKSLFEKYLNDSYDIGVIIYMLENGAVLDAGSELIQSGMRRIILGWGMGKGLTDGLDMFVGCIDRIHPGFLMKCGLDVVAGKILGKETDVDKDGWIHASTVTVPEDVYEIPQEIFMNNTEIKAAVFHGGVRSIGARAFYGCTNLRWLIFLDNGVCMIGEEAFSKCGSLQEVSIANGTWIGKCAFKDCSALKDIRFAEGDGIRENYLKAYGFYYYYGEPYGEPKYLWGEEAFKNCIQLEKIEDFRVGGIGKSCFLGCRNLQAVKGEIYGTLGDYAFWGCNLLKYVTVRYNYSGPWDEPTVKLGKYVFPYNEYEEFVFDAGFEVLYDDISLHTAEVQKVLSREPYRPEDLYDDYHTGANDDDYSWDEDYMESTSEYWDDLYAKADKYLDALEADIENERLSEGNERLSEGIEIPPDMVDISHTFMKCKNLKKVIFSNRCKTKKMESAFSYSTVESCKLPGTVENMEFAFEHCENLTKVEFWREPLSLKNLNSAFWDCRRLKEFIVPASVESLSGTFEGCHSLKKIIFKDKSRLKEIGLRAFRECIQLREIAIPESVEKIGSSAFSGCISLEKVIILGKPEFEVPLEDIFDGCIMLKKIIYDGQEIVLDKNAGN